MSGQFLLLHLNRFPGTRRRLLDLFLVLLGAALAFWLLPEAIDSGL